MGHEAGACHEEAGAWHEEVGACHEVHDMRWRIRRRRPVGCAGSESQSQQGAAPSVPSRSREARPHPASLELEIETDASTNSNSDAKEGAIMKATRNHTFSTGLSNLATLLPATNELLYHVGLQRRRSRARRTAQAVGLFGAGALFGTGIAMLLAPKSGRQVRREIGERARSVKAYVRPEEPARRQA